MSMPSAVEETLELALGEARSALSAAELRRAHAESLVAKLRTEVAGLEAAVARRAHEDAQSSIRLGQTAVPSLIRSGVPSSVPSSVDPTVLGIATLVLLLMEAHRDWATKKRATAVELVLRGARRPVHRSDITETLQRVGRPKENLRDVSAALAYLHRIGKVKPIGDGSWVHSDVADQYIETGSSSQKEV